MAQAPSDVRRTGGSLRRIDPLLGPGAGVLLGVAAGFFCFAMPARILVPLLDRFGLPPALAAGRGLPVIVVAILVAGATWGMFRLFDRPARARPAPLALTGDAAPVLRRADAHPDAPARRPIFAGSDLGAPLDMAEPLSPEAGDPLETPAIPEADVPPASIAAAPILAGDAPESPASLAPSVGAEPPVSLTALLGRLELALARKALALDVGAMNVTPLKREIRPVEGSLAAAFDRLQRRAARG